MKRHDVIESMVYAPSPTACKLLYTDHFKLTSIATPSAVSYATMSELESLGTVSLLSPDSVPDIDMDIDSSYTQFSSFPRLSTKTPYSLTNHKSSWKENIISTILDCTCVPFHSYTSFYHPISHILAYAFPH
jgi:hypothetical protein